MAGKRQHILPQFLLKGFSSRKRGNQIYAWVFSRNKPPFETNIINIGIEKDFYENQDASRIDDKFTLVEKELSRNIDEQKNIIVDKRIDSSIPSRILNHLFIRSKNLRATAIASLKIFFDELIQKAPDSKFFETCLLNYFKKNPDILLDKLKPKLSGLELANKQREFLKNIAIPSFFEAHKGIITSLFKDLICKMESVMPKVVSGAHLEAMKENVIPEPRTSLTQKLNWHICVREPGDFILGDVGSIGKISKSNIYRSLLIGVKEIDEVIMPISSVLSHK